ncbi:MAG: dTMP kinase [Erysipelotrichaceae bacterium]|nr:dTMP kinase [Erysipelotrichaceae bacterium]
MSLFITLEGPEGSGKTSAIKLVREALEQMGHEIIMTREPGGTPISEQIRNVILDKSNTAMDSRTEALLYAASRRQHLVEKIWPALKEGKIVFCDRYLDSSLSYQGHARGLGIDDILKVNEYATERTYPDITFLFDIDPELGLERINKNKDREVNRLDVEKLSFHQKVREGYLILSKRFPDRYIVIDASKPLEEVSSNVLKEILNRLGK